MLSNMEHPFSFDSYDFSNLYTNFTHVELIEKFGFLLNLLLQLQLVKIKVIVFEQDNILREMLGGLSIMRS